MVTEIHSDGNKNQLPSVSEHVLEVKNLRVGYHTPRGLVRAVNNVSFFLKRGERLGLVGESGSGKTTTALSLMRLLQSPAEIEGGEVLLDGKDLLSLSQEEMRQTRAAEIALIPQGAMNSLNPMMKIGEQLRDTIRAHRFDESRAVIDSHIHTVLESVDLPTDIMSGYAPRVEWRHEAARLYCHGHPPAPQGDHRRRANQRARCRRAAPGDGGHWERYKRS